MLRFMIRHLFPHLSLAAQLRIIRSVGARTIVAGRLLGAIERYGSEERCVSIINEINRLPELA